MTTEYTSDQKRKIVVAYIASGNSVESIIEQLLTTLYTTENDVWGSHFDDIVKDIQQARQEVPEEFESSTEEELQCLEQLYTEHLEYSANSPILG